MSEDKKPQVKIGTIGHVDSGKITLDEAISKYLDATKVDDSTESRDAIRAKVRRQIEREKLVRQATVMSLLLANVDDLIDADWDALLEKKSTPQKRYVIKPIRHERRK